MAVRGNGRYIDGTLGGGGHTQAMLDRSGPSGRVLGLDQDTEAIARTTQRLSDYGDRLTVCHGNFAELAALAASAGFTDVDGVLLDLGLSSDQLDTPERGFSFQADGPLDMRMNPHGRETAADLVRDLPEAELARILWQWGEEPSARRIAAALVRARESAPIETTGQLADLVEKAVGGRRGRHHPATRTFQALRIAVNHELSSLEEGLSAALSLLRPGGRLAVITFHSLEDRAVKHFFRDHVGRMESLAQGGSRWVGSQPPAAHVVKRPITAGAEEVEQNPRSRSAKLRVIERREVPDGR